MTKDEVRDFFDKCAPQWDANMLRNESAITKILDNAGVEKGVRVLDVACGTGVLFNDYLDREVACVKGVDLSPEMVKIAKMNYNDSRIDVLCDDIEEYNEDDNYDVCMVYNAFPHFPDPDKLIEKLASLIRPGGKLSVAHGMSAEELEKHHSGEAVKVSRHLPETEEIAGMMERCGIIVDCKISDDEMYQVAGTKA